MARRRRCSRSNHAPRGCAFAAEFSRLLRRAQRAHEAANSAKRSGFTPRCWSTSPENFDALHGLGQLHYHCGRLDTALVLFQTALRSDRDRAEGFASLGLVFHVSASSSEALASYDEGLSHCARRRGTPQPARRGAA